MHAPPEQEEISTFCRLARRFHDIGINVPKIIQTDEERGFVLMSDLGSDHYLDRLRRGCPHREDGRHRFGARPT